MKSITQLLEKHPHYAQVSTNANYLYRSYIGGDVYRAGEYLTKYIGEESAPGDQYRKRLLSTPLDNHVQTTVDIYRSFLFRQLPVRELGVLNNNPEVLSFLNDADLDGQSLDSFLKTVNDLAMVTGSVWILTDKGSYQVETQAEAIALGLRSYCVMYTPQNVLDWTYTRDVSGRHSLSSIKLLESDSDTASQVTIWTPDLVERYTILKSEGVWDSIAEYSEYANPLGYVPVVQHAPLRSPVKGVGYSLVADVADGQRYVYNLMSELEQTIRISGHPTLVKTPSTSATAGAGGIVSIQEDLDPGLRPYLLEPSGAGITGILDTISATVAAMQRMTHTSAVQAVKGSPVSGVALKVEQNLLNAKLSDLSDTLRETEIKLWKQFADWQNISLPTNFDIQYSTTFDLQDEHAELALLEKAQALLPAGSLTEQIQTKIQKVLDK